MNKLRRKMMAFMARKMIACDDASYLTSYGLDNRLTLRQRMQLRLHLMSCHLCRKYASQLSELEKIMQSYRECGHRSCVHHLAEDTGRRMQEVIAEETGAG